MNAGEYLGRALRILEKLGLSIWSEATFDTTRGRFRGIVLPPTGTADDGTIVLKLPNGYNVGIAADTVMSAVEIGHQEPYHAEPSGERTHDPAKPRVKLLGTGGTIASRLDYRSGAAVPAFSPGELFASVPELAEFTNLETEQLYGELSENIGPEHWVGIAHAIEREIESGVDGIVVGHGTDTMHHTAAAVSFMVQDSPVPIVFVGAQRSPDRPASDAALNLIHATRTAAQSDIAEVLVCMFGPSSDEYGLLHRGARVRKMHTSHRSAFRTIGDVPVGAVSREGVVLYRQDYRRRRADREVNVRASFERRTTLVYYYPDMQPDIIDSLVDNGYRGIVLAGTGMGHVNRQVFPALKRANEKGVAVYMTAQTLWGYVHMHVYETGRDIMALGVVPAENMLPEIAWVKLGWALSLTDDLDEVKRIMLTPIAGEITEREPHDGYLVFQSGRPWLREYFKRFKH